MLQSNGCCASLCLSLCDSFSLSFSLALSLYLLLSLCLCLPHMPLLIGLRYSPNSAWLVFLLSRSHFAFLNHSISFSLSSLPGSIILPHSLSFLSLQALVSLWLDYPSMNPSLLLVPQRVCFFNVCQEVSLLDFLQTFISFSLLPVLNALLFP